MRSIISSSIKAFLLAALALAAHPAAAHYFDIYGEANRTLPAAQAAFDALPEDATEAERAERVSDLIMGLIGKAKYREAYELWLANRELDLHPDAVAGAMGHGLVAFAPDDTVRAEYAVELEAIAEEEGCSPCYARTFAAHHLGRYHFNVLTDADAGIAWHQRALDLAMEDLAEDDPARVNFSYQLSAYLRAVDLEQAEAQSRTTEAMALDLLPRDDHLGWLYVYLANALVALDKGRTAEAADLFGRIADIGVKEWGPDDPQLLGIYQNTAVLLSRLGRTSEAVEAALRGEGNEAYSDDIEKGYHRALIGTLMLGDARAAEAVEYLRVGVDLLETSREDHLWQANAEADLATALSLTGAHEEALERVERALAVHRARLDPDNAQRREREVQAAMIFERAGQTALAAETIGPVLEHHESVMIDRFARNQDRAAIAAAGNSMFRNSVAIALGTGEVERAWRSAQLAIISDLTLSSASLSYPGDAAGFAAALDAVRSARESEQDARLALASGEGSSAALSEAREAVEAAQARLEADYPDFAEFLRPRPFTIADTRALLAEDEAYVVPIVFEDRVVTLAITSDGLAWDEARTPLNSTRALVTRIRASLDAGLGGEDTFDYSAAHALFTRIFTPKVREATAGKARLIFPAGGAFASIPLSVLLTEERSEGDAPAWLIREHSLVMTPNLGQRTRARSSATKGFAGIGAPVLADQPGSRAALRGSLIDVADVRELPSLPGALAELEALSGTFAHGGSLLLTGSDATEPTVKATPLSDFKVLAFATHGLVAGQIEGLAEPALVLTPPSERVEGDDGLLTASEIASLELAADWIILSACNTAAGDGRDNATFSGLARAFQLAGARALLLSHWPVRDDAATRLSVTTVQGASEGLTRDEALRRAQLALIEDQSVPGGASPSIWAPFVLVE